MLQDEVLHYLAKFGISRIHMARQIGICQPSISAWFNKKLVLPDYHVLSIEKYLQTLKTVDSYLQENGLVL